MHHEPPAGTQAMGCGVRAEQREQEHPKNRSKNGRQRKIEMKNGISRTQRNHPPLCHSGGLASRFSVPGFGRFVSCFFLGSELISASEGKEQELGEVRGF